MLFSQKHCSLQKSSVLHSPRRAWGLLALSTVSAFLFSYFVLQILYNLQPCTYCVSIRFYVLLISITACIAFCFPILGYYLQYLVLFCIGKVFYMLYLLHTVVNDTKLICPSVVVYPFNIPLDTWFPRLFAPLASCQDYPLRIIGLSVLQCTFIFMSICVLFILWIFYANYRCSRNKAT